MTHYRKIKTLVSFEIQILTNIRQNEIKIRYFNFGF